MSYFDNKSELYIRTNIAEENATGLYEVGYNDFHVVKPLNAFYSRPFKTLHFIISGSGTYHLAGKTYKVHEGEVFFTPSNIPICYYPDEDNPWQYVWFSFATEALSQFIPLLDMSIDSPIKELSHFEKVASVIEEAFSRQADEYIPVFNFVSAFMQILALEARGIQSDIDQKNIYIQSIKKCVENNYTSQDFSVDTLCDILHLSHSYICRIFHASEGITIINYIEALRMKYATDLLVNSDLSVSRIAETIGYRDPLHFMKRFKARYGVTAMQYRGGKG